MEENPPAVSVIGGDGIWIELGEGFPEQGIHQLIDGWTPRSVIQMTLGARGLDHSIKTLLDRPLITGESLCLRLKSTEIIEIERRWMAASKRMVLGIPLQPQTMNSADWMALPGIGPKLAAAIELDRQKNGGFRSFSELERVSGIGPGRLAAWERFFEK
jgi:competence protein ComEA